MISKKKKLVSVIRLPLPKKKSSKSIMEGEMRRLARLQRYNHLAIFKWEAGRNLGSVNSGRHSQWVVTSNSSDLFEIERYRVPIGAHLSLGFIDGAS